MDDSSESACCGEEDGEPMPLLLLPTDAHERGNSVVDEVSTNGGGEGGQLSVLRSRVRMFARAWTIAERGGAGRRAITVEVPVYSDDSEDVCSSSSEESGGLCRSSRCVALCCFCRSPLVASACCGGELPALSGSSVGLELPFSDCLRKPNHVNRRFFSSGLSLDLRKGGITASSSGVCKLADPSEEQEEPGVSWGRERTEVAVSTGVFGAFAKREVERDLARRGTGPDRGGTVEEEEGEVEAKSDFPPRPNERADAKEGIGMLLNWGERNGKEAMMRMVF